MYTVQNLSLFRTTKAGLLDASMLRDRPPRR
jgi:hypothetical protein